MIIIYTDYDDVARLLAECATNFTRAAGRQVTALLAPPADSQSQGVHNALAAHREEAVIFFGHGEPAGPVAQDKLLLFQGLNDQLLRGRLVFAICCYSIQWLEQTATGLGLTALGFSGLLFVPLHPPYSHLLQQSITAGIEPLLSGSNVGAIGGALRDALEAVAQKLTAGSTEDQVNATFIRINANRVKTLGDLTQTLK